MSSKVLYGVLNWGLGHASRSTPIISSLLNKGHDVIIASSGIAYELLKKNFPAQSFIELPDFDVRYQKKEQNAGFGFMLKAGASYQGFNKMIASSRSVVSELVIKESITHIISDNHFGVFNETIPSVIISHQLQLKSPVLGKTVNKINTQHLNKFDEIWVPDYSIGDGLSGELSCNSALAHKTKLIGLLSQVKIERNGKPTELCVLLSGPEPQRTLLSERLHGQINELSSYLKSQFSHIHFIEGCKQLELNSNEFVSHYGLLSQTEVQEILSRSKVVICRSGYSSLMDLYLNEIPAIIVPTPGQTEQLYLAEHNSKRNKFVAQSQVTIDIRTALDGLSTTNETQEANSNSKRLLDTTLQNFFA